MQNKTYLGDSVYAQIDVDDESLKLTTENDSSGPTNIIILDVHTLKTLIQYIESHYGQHIFRR